MDISATRLMAARVMISSMGVTNPVMARSAMKMDISAMTSTGVMAMIRSMVAMNPVPVTIATRAAH